MPERNKRPIELITRLRYMMEYMALCGDPTLFDAACANVNPAPSGVPMGILSMPDFVVDVAIDSMVNATAKNRGHLDALDVGGRAGRLVWVLQTLGGQRLGWYNLKYVAKAGDVGELVLSRRFNARSDSNIVDPVSLRYIIPSPDGFDWYHVYGSSTETAESPRVGREVTVSEIDELPYSLVDLLADIRYIVIASKDKKHAIDAISIVKQGLQRLSASRCFSQDHRVRIPIGILLDLSALGNSHDAKLIVDAFATAREKIEGIDIETTALCQDDAPPTFFNQFDYVLIRDGSSLRIGEIYEELPNLLSLPVAREAVTAGYVVAAACNLGWKLLRQWYRYFPNLRPISSLPHHSYPRKLDTPITEGLLENSYLPALNKIGDDPIGPADRVRIAALFGQHTRLTPLHYRQLITAIASAHEADISIPETRETPFTRHLEPSALSDSLSKREADLNGTLHLVPRFEDANLHSTKSLFIPPSAVEDLARSCSLRDAHLDRRPAKQIPISKAIMFDLDATLIDSEGLRDACWFRGLQKFFREIEFAISGPQIRTVIEIYQTFVYKNYDRFRSLLKDNPDIPPEWQPCDFRQVWNHPYAWAAALWILDRVRTGPLHGRTWQHATWHSILQSHRKSRPNREQCACHVCRQIELVLSRHKSSISDRRDLTRPVVDTFTRFKVPIQAARQAFWTVDYPPYPQARSCVQNLRALPGCEVYIVTEGDEETQIQKLTCTGLHDLFPRHRILSTGAASSAEYARTDLEKLLQLNKRLLDDLRSVKAHLQQTQDLIPLVQMREATINAISFLKDSLDALYKKGYRRFYSAVIDAIRQNPESPAQLLQSFIAKQEHIISEHAPRPMQFFMIGDRYDNDCRPLLEIFPSTRPDKTGIGTCQLLSGKRATSFCPPRDLPPTKFVCDTLVQVAHILQRPSTWNDIAILDDVTPPVLLEIRNGVIHYGPRGGSSEEMDGDQLEPLAPRFGDLCWARVDDTLWRERAIQEMLDQIERDLAVCDTDSLYHLFESTKRLIDKWLIEASADKSAMTYLKGALKVLSGINWWHYHLRRPLLRPKLAASDSIESSLSSVLVGYARILSLFTSWGIVSGVPDLLPQGIDPRTILDAMPYSEPAVDFLRDYERSLRDPDFRRFVRDWLAAAKELPLTGAQTTSAV